MHDVLRDVDVLQILHARDPLTWTLRALASEKRRDRFGVHDLAEVLPSPVLGPREHRLGQPPRVVSGGLRAPGTSWWRGSACSAAVRSLRCHVACVLRSEHRASWSPEWL